MAAIRGEKNTIWKGVPQPEPLIDAARRAALGDDRAKSQLRGAISVMKTIPARARVVKFLEHVLRNPRV